MRTVMIVDDEKLVRAGLQSIINWEEYGYKIIGVYKNGLEAWDAIKERQPDVVLTDIKMPIMDGLELIKVIKNAFPNINIIILSSYEDFQYTRKAIQLQVQDYFVKHQLESDELIRVLNQATYTDNDDNKTSISPLDEEKMILNRWIESTNRDSEFLSSEWNNKDFPNIKQYFRNRQYSNMGWAVIQPLQLTDEYSNTQKKAYTALLEEAFYRLDSFVFIGKENMVYHILFGIRETKALQVQKRSTEELSDFIESIKKDINIELAVGVSSMLTTEANLNGEQLYERCKQAMNTVQSKFYHGSQLYFFNSFMPYIMIADEQWLQYQMMIKDWIRNQNEIKMMHWFSTLPKINNYHIWPTELIRLSRIMLNLFMDHILSKYHVNLLTKDNHFKTIYTQVNNGVSSWHELYDLTHSAILDVNREVYQTQNSWIQEINHYIENHFNQQLKLEEVSKHMSFSMNYFSKRFQKETGMSFTDYLTQYRIQKAIEYFEQTEWSTEEIAVRVGYQNPNYFIKVFKKMMGETITDYKKRKQL